MVKSVSNSTRRMKNQNTYIILNTIILCATRTMRRTKHKGRIDLYSNRLEATSNVIVNPCSCSYPAGKKEPLGRYIEDGDCICYKPTHISQCNATKNTSIKVRPPPPFGYVYLSIPLSMLKL